MVFKNRTLLAVTGLSPQIVTETLYALLQQEGVDKMPNRVKLLTTQEGFNRAKLTLLEAKSGYFHQFVREYGLEGKVIFELTDIHVIKNHDGQLLEDILTPSDNAAAADCITDLVRQLTQDEDSQLHVSIAGGRKTMGFYLGYAFSLFARPQDVLSHVLVSKYFESHSDFYYPPKNGVVLYTHDKKPIHTDDAEVWLAEIPVVKLRHGVPTEQLQLEMKYTDAVGELDKSLKPAKVEVDIPNQKVWCDDVLLNIKKFHLIWFVHLLIRKKAEQSVNLNESLFEELCATGALLYGNRSDAEEILDYFNPKTLKKGFIKYDALGIPLRIRSENSKIFDKIKKILPFAYRNYRIHSSSNNKDLSFYVAIDPENISIQY